MASAKKNGLSVCICLISIGFLQAQTVNLKYDRVENFSEGMAQVYIGNKTGYIDVTGKEVVPIIYDKDYREYDFKFGVAKVMLNKLFGLVDKKGKLVVPCEYERIGDFSEGLAEARKPGTGVGYINNKGEVVVPFKYSIALRDAEFSEGLAKVELKGKYGFVNSKGIEIVPPKYEMASRFTDGLALVNPEYYNGKYGFINKSGELVIPHKYDKAGYFVDGMAAVNIGAVNKGYERTGGLWGVIDKTGKEIIPVNYDFVNVIGNGLAVVSKGGISKGLSGVINSKGEIIIPIQYSTIFAGKDRLIVNKPGTSGSAIFDFTGKQLTDFTFYPMDYNGVSDGLWLMKELKGTELANYGYTDNNGKTVIFFLYESAFNFFEGFASVKKDGKWGVIDKTGKPILAFKYEFVGEFHNGWAPVQQEKNGKWTFINQQGKLINIDNSKNNSPKTPAGTNTNSSSNTKKYTYRFRLKDFDIVVENGQYFKEADSLTGGKWGVVDKNNNIIIPAIYDCILSTDSVLKLLFVYKDCNYTYTKRRGPVNIEASVNRSIGIFGFDGKQKYPFTIGSYAFVKDKGQHIRIVDKNTNKIALLNKNAATVIPAKYDILQLFNDSLVYVSANKKHGVINLKQEVLVPLKYDNIPIQDSINNQLCVIFADVKDFRIIGGNGKRINATDSLKKKYLDFQTNSLLAKKYTFRFTYHNYQVVNENGINIAASDSLVGGKWGAIDNAGKIIIPTVHDYITYDSVLQLFFVYKNWNFYRSNKKNYYVATDNSVFGIYGTDGKEKFPFTISNYYIMAHKYIMMIDAKTKMYGVLNPECKQIVPCVYELIYDFADSLIAAKKNGKFGLINLKNEVLIPFDYDKVYTGQPNSGVTYQFQNASSVVKVDAAGRRIDGNNKSIAGAASTPAEADFQKAFNASKNSEERGKAYAKFLETVYPTLDSASLAVIVKQKNEQIAAIDFYALFEAAMKATGVNSTKILQAIQVNLSAKQKQVFVKYANRITENFQRKYSQNLPPLPEPPTDTLQPGQPWKE